VDSIQTGGNVAGISFSGTGLASGIDTQALIDALVALEEKPVQEAQSKQQGLQSLSSLVKTLSTKLGTLRDAAAALTTLGQGLAFSASSSDNTKVVASAGSNAAAGPHAISVSQLASAASSSLTASTVITDPDAVLNNTGNVTITYAGTSTAIDVTGKSLDQVRDLINSSVTGVTASVVNVGASGSPDYRLVVSGQASGAANSLSFTKDAGVDFNFNTITSAKNAMFKVDGVDIQRDTNSISDVIPGVSFTLLNTTQTGQDVTLTVSPDVTAVKTKIQTFVNAYNDVLNFINSNSTYDAGTKVAGAFFGDSTIDSIKSQLTNMALKGGSEYTSNEGTSSLGILGVAVQQDGTLLIDDTKLTDKLNTDVTKVLDLFADTDGTAGPDKGLALEFRDFADFATNGGTDPITGVSYDGLLVAKSKSISDQIASLQKTIDDGEQHVNDYAASLKAKFTAFEEAMTVLKAQQTALAAKFGTPTQ
jgi:flagellar hook-associated protein 2